MNLELLYSKEFFEGFFFPFEVISKGSRITNDVKLTTRNSNRSLLRENQR